MANPVRKKQGNREITVSLPLTFYTNWINGVQFPWPNEPSLTDAENKTFRDELEERIYRDGHVLMSVHFFARIRKCTEQQLGTLVKCLQAEGCYLDVHSLDGAIVNMEKQGSLAKLKQLYPNLTWDDFNTCCGVQEALSGSMMPLYANDVLAWYQSECSDDADSGYLPSMLCALQQCKLELSTVLPVMEQVRSLGLVDFSLYESTETPVSLIHDTTLATAMARREELANQFAMLHVGWKVQYPIALMFILMREEYQKSFDVPPIEILHYPTAHVDLQIASIFNGTYIAKANDDFAVVTAAKLVQTLYDKQSQFHFCIDGTSSLNLKNENCPLEVDSSIFQDVGHP